MRLAKVERRYLHLGNHFCFLLGRQLFCRFLSCTRWVVALLANMLPLHRVELTDPFWSDFWIGDVLVQILFSCRRTEAVWPSFCRVHCDGEEHQQPKRKKRRYRRPHSQFFGDLEDNDDNSGLRWHANRPSSHSVTEAPRAGRDSQTQTQTGLLRQLRTRLDRRTNESLTRFSRTKLRSGWAGTTEGPTGCCPKSQRIRDSVVWSRLIQSLSGDRDTFSKRCGRACSGEGWHWLQREYYPHSLILVAAWCRPIGFLIGSWRGHAPCRLFLQPLWCPRMISLRSMAEQPLESELRRRHQQGPWPNPQRLPSGLVPFVCALPRLHGQRQTWQQEWRPRALPREAMRDRRPRLQARLHVINQSLRKKRRLSWRRWSYHPTLLVGWTGFLRTYWLPLIS